MHIPFAITRKVSKLVRERVDFKQWEYKAKSYKEIKGNNGIGRVKWGE